MKSSLNFSRIAFTLIELLVVIAIIGILSGLIVITMSGATQKATIAKAQVFSNSLRNALALNLISEWKFDELTAATEGASIQDTWGGGNTGTLSTNSDGLDKIRTGTDCVSGSCLSFDGTNDYVYVSGSDATTSNLAITGAITLSAWVKFAYTGTAMYNILARGADGNSNGNYGYGFWRRVTGNLIQFSTCSTTTRDVLSSTSGINDTNWHLIIATWDGTTNTDGKKIYIDGVLSGQKTSTISAIGQPAYQFRIGRDSLNAEPLNGSIDDIRVYNEAIPTSQIQEQYYTGLNNLLANGQITSEEYQNRVVGIK
jgi:prepilin-type N-terminal cleavage/methylation domain-containing protein